MPGGSRMIRSGPFSRSMEMIETSESSSSPNDFDVLIVVVGVIRRPVVAWIAQRYDLGNRAVMTVQREPRTTVRPDAVAEAIRPINPSKPARQPARPVEEAQRCGTYQEPSRRPRGYGGIPVGAAGNGTAAGAAQLVRRTFAVASINPAIVTRRTNHRSASDERWP